MNICYYMEGILVTESDHTERRKGYAVQMIGLALEECKNGNQKVLMVCDKDNIGSAKSIIKKRRNIRK